MTSSTRRSPLSLALQVGCLTLLWSVLLVAYDAWLCQQRASGSARVESMALFFAFGIGTVFILVFPVGWVRAVLREWAAPATLRRLAIGALDGAFLSYLVFYRQRYETITVTQRWIAGGLLVVGGAVAFWLAPRWPRVSRYASAAVLVGALGLEHLLPMRENRMVHLALDFAAAAGFAGLFDTVVARWSTRTQGAACALAILFALTPRFIVRASEPVRGLVYDMSTHTRVHALPLRKWLKVKASKANRMDFVTCEGSYTPRCAGHGPNEPSTLSGAGKGADVLMLTVDSMRWDHAHGMPLLKKELGPHVQFDRAVSAAPRTAHSFGASLRGRPVRQTPFEKSGAHPGVAENATETLGHVLNANGYRAVHAPTHAFLFPYTSIADGFEPLIDTAQFDPVRGRREHSVPLLTVIDLTLRAAKDTKSPMFAWMHAMDTHSSYRWDGGKGPASPAGQLHAARDVDKKLARFVREFRAIRGNRPLVIAVYGDHGEEFGEHGGTYHGSTTFAEQVRVMFWLSLPGVGDRRVDAPVSTSAIAATLLDILGVETPCTFTVPSVLACIERQDACPHLAVSELLPFGRKKKAVLAGYTGDRYRLLYDREQDVVRLFDANNDPYERFDLSRVKPEKLTQMRRLARAWDERYCVEPDLESPIRTQ